MIKNIAIQILVFVLIFNVISWFKESSLLATNGEIKAPDFELFDTNNNKVSLADLTNKPTLLFFWAPWCSICKLTMPNLDDFYKSHSEQFNVVSVALSFQNNKEVVDYMENNNYTFVTLLGNDKVSTDYKIQAFPTYYVLNTDGIVVNKSLGYSTEIGMLIRSSIL